MHTGHPRAIAQALIPRGPLGLTKSDLLAAFENVAPEDRQDVRKWFDCIAIDAATLGAYFDARGTAGCGDSGHEHAVKMADHAARLIRKALGYTYP